MRRVLVARLDSMGDVLVGGPAVRAVAATAEVVLLAGPQGAAAARLLPGVAEVRVLAAPWISPTDRPIDAALVAEVARIAAETGVQEAVVLTSFHQSPLPLALLLRLAGVRRITGASVDAAGGLLDVRLIPGEDLPENLPEPLRALRIAAAAGFALPEGDDARLAAELPERPAAAGFGPYLGGALGLPELGAVLRDADVVIVGNTGPAHLAAAAGTPVVSLFAPVVPAERWAPWGVPVELLGDQEAACRGSRARVCPIAGHPCLAAVSPESVVDAAERLVGAAA